MVLQFQTRETANCRICAGERLSKAQGIKQIDLRTGEACLAHMMCKAQQDTQASLEMIEAVSTVLAVEIEQHDTSAQ